MKYQVRLENITSTDRPRWFAGELQAPFADHGEVIGSALPLADNMFHSSVGERGREGYSAADELHARVEGQELAPRVAALLVAAAGMLVWVLIATSNRVSATELRIRCGPLLRAA